MIYQWKPQAGINIDAQKAGEHLEALRIKNNGGLTPRAIVDDARPEGSLLHPAFEWDDAVAADKHREEQARHLARSITVVIREDADDVRARPVRAFVSVEEEGRRAYTSISVAMSREPLRHQLVSRAWAELRQWRQRYNDVAELAELVAQVGGIIDGTAAE